LQGFKVSEKNNKNNKKKKKNSQMIIRINREVRHFIREFIAKHGDQ